MAGLTQPNYNNGGSNAVDLNRMVHANTAGTNSESDLPTLPPLNSPSPHMKASNGSHHQQPQQQERWMAEKDKRYSRVRACSKAEH